MSTRAIFPPRTLIKRQFLLSDIHVEILDQSWIAPAYYEELVRKAWEEKVEEAKKESFHIWDGLYYRVTNIGELENDPKPLVFRLGTVPYRFIGTLSRLKDAYIENKLEPLNHLSTAAIIRTSDGKYLFGKRNRARIQLETVDLIGGGVQQDEIEVHSGADIEKNMYKEIREEAGIEEKDIRSMTGIGVVFSTTSNVLVIVLAELRLTKQEAVAAFETRNDDEMSEPVFVSEEDLPAFLKGMSSYRALIPDLLDTQNK
ncbi:MAG TPA: NUDIX hydrolase [Candidatus Paceibacterota bacterium]|nr:NUDIX hydrolase [Candidatus Paceibacterota bacterium]